MSNCQRLELEVDHGLQREPKCAISWQQFDVATYLTGALHAAALSTAALNNRYEASSNARSRMT